MVAPEKRSTGKQHHTDFIRSILSTQTPRPAPDVNDTISWEALFLAADEQQEKGLQDDELISPVKCIYLASSASCCDMQGHTRPWEH